jgi:putative ABC transport system ATP-binding protein
VSTETATQREENVYRGTKEQPSIVTLKGLAKTYYRGKEPVRVLENLDLEVPDGSFEALMGPSGSGKSTLLNLIAGLDKPTRGEIRVAGSNLAAMSDAQLARWRADTIGFIFQAYNLMPVLTAAQNVELPLLLTSLSASERKKRVSIALKVVGLEERQHHYPRQLSGGQEQRVAIARAIVNDPKIIVADEPTGDLDRKSADDILALLERLNKEFKKTIFMVTHDPAAAERATVRRRLDKGQLV